MSSVLDQGIIVNVIRKLRPYVDNIVIICNPKIRPFIEELNLGFPVDTDEDCPLEKIYIKDSEGDTK